MSKVVAIGPPKEAALYFDKVLPLDLSSNVFTYFSKVQNDGPLCDEGLTLPLDPDEVRRIVESLALGDQSIEFAYWKQAANTMWLPLVAAIGRIRSDEELFDTFKNSKEFEMVRSTCALAEVNLNDVIAEFEKDEFDWQAHSHVMTARISELLDSSGFANSDSWVGENTVARRSSISQGDNSEYALTLRNLGLVDPSALSWEQVVEFRKDEKSRASLREFRILFREQFSGKDPNYVEDKLLSGLEKHQKTAKAWGFEIVDRSFSIIGSRENLGTSALAIGATIATGAPIPLIAASGVAFSMFGCSLEIAKVIREKNAVLDSGYSYLSNLRKLGQTSG